MSIWIRNGNVWRFELLPWVTVEPAPDGVWEARCGGKTIPFLPKSGSSVMVMAAAYKYFDERVELHAFA